MQLRQELGNFRRLLKFRHFHIVETLVMKGSMRLAAEHLAISIAAVSKSCIEIENILGARLFERSEGKLIPTQLCQCVLATGRRIHAEISRLESDLVTLNGSIRGKVKIGLQAPALEQKLPLFLAAAKQAHPSLTISVIHGPRPWLISELESHRLDLILVDLLGLDAHPRLTCNELNVECCVVTTPTEIFSLSDVLENWKTFSEMIWVLPLAGMAVRDQFDAILKVLGLQDPSHLIEYSSPTSTFSIQKACAGASLVAASMIPAELMKGLPGLKHQPFRTEIYSRTGMVNSSDINMSPATKAISNIIASTYS